MRTSDWHVCLIAASAFSAIAFADFRVITGQTTKTDEYAEFANFAKSYELQSKASTAIESLDLTLAGTVYVSYSHDLPDDVVGYVNVSGSSKAVVEAVEVNNEFKGLLPDVSNFDDVFGNTKKQLSVTLSRDVSHGYLLTEITLSARSKVNKVSTSRTANVIIQKDVLMSQSSTRGQKISASGLSTVYVSTPDTAVKVRQLELEATGGAKIQYRAKNVFLWQKLELEARGDTNIKFLCPVVVAGKLEVEAESRDSEICMSADEVEAALAELSGKSYISMPNANRKFGSRGTRTCALSKEPPREAAEFVSPAGRRQSGFDDASTPAADDAGSYTEDDVKIKSEDGAQSNILNRTMTAYSGTKDALYNAKDNVINGTMTAFDNAKDSILSGAKDAFNDATGNLLGGGSKSKN